MYQHLVVFPNTNVGEWHRCLFVTHAPQPWGATFEEEMERLPLEAGLSGSYGPLERLLAPPEGFVVQRFLTSQWLPEEEVGQYARQWGAWSWTLNRVCEQERSTLLSAQHDPGARIEKGLQDSPES